MTAQDIGIDGILRADHRQAVANPIDGGRRMPAPAPSESMMTEKPGAGSTSESSLLPLLPFLPSKHATAKRVPAKRSAEIPAFRKHGKIALVNIHKQSKRPQALITTTPFHVLKGKF